MRITEVESTPSSQTAAYLESFAALEQGLNGERNLKHHHLRRVAFTKFLEQGFPSTKSEEWKYTTTSTLARQTFSLPKGICKLAKLPEELGLVESPTRLVFVDGIFAGSLSHQSSSGVSVGVLSELFSNPNLDTELYEGLCRDLGQVEHAFSSINTAFMQEGAWVRIPAGVSLDHPIELLFIASGQESHVMYHPRIVVIVEKGASATLVETHTSLERASTFKTIATDIRLDDNAKLDHLKIQLECPQTCHVSLVNISQASQSKYRSFVANVGGGLVRNESRPILAGEFADTVLTGLNILGADQHVDNLTVMTHATAHCESRQVFKSVLADEAKSVFNGTIIVKPDAQKTNAIQSSASLLLSDRAQAYTMPQLKIWADDVKCTHGATVGQIDDDAIFYLRSRGLPEQVARKILAKAFCAEVIEELPEGAVRDRVTSEVMTKLDHMLIA